MTRDDNPVRGEAMLQLGDRSILLRPSFAALVAAEEELGPLFGLVERAASGQLKLSEMVALFWHCRFYAPDDLDRDGFAEAVAAHGIAASTPVLKILLSQILSGQ